MTRLDPTPPVMIHEGQVHLDLGRGSGLSFTPAEARALADRINAQADLLDPLFGATMKWEDDWGVGSHVEEYGMDYPEVETCEVGTLYDRHGNVLDSLGCVDNADDGYRAEVEADLREAAVREARARIEARAGATEGGVILGNGAWLCGDCASGPYAGDLDECGNCGAVNR